MLADVATGPAMQLRIEQHPLQRNAVVDLATKLFPIVLHVATRCKKVPQVAALDGVHMVVGVQGVGARTLMDAVCQ